MKEIESFTRKQQMEKEGSCCHSHEIQVQYYEVTTFFQHLTLCVELFRVNCRRP